MWALYTVKRLAQGHQGPSTGTCWWLAKALRAGLDDCVAVGLDVRLQADAGDSLRSFSTRTHRRRERLAAELAVDGLPVTGTDNFGSYVLSLLVAAA